MADRPLTPLQEAFCREYVIDLNGSAAYARACAALAKPVAKSGGVNANKLLKLAKVRLRIAELGAKVVALVEAEMAGVTAVTTVAEQHAADAEQRAFAAALGDAEAVEESTRLASWIVGQLVENVRRAMQAVPVMREGKAAGEYQYDGAVANKALELLGKREGLFKDVVETRDLSLEDALKRLSDA